MARVKYSGLIHDISGSVGGSTFQLNAYGATIRNKPKNTATQSIRQNLSRSYMSQVVAAWAALSQQQQSVWDRCQTFFNIKSWNNSSSLLYGRAVFLQYNLTRLQAGLDILLAPSFLTIPYTQYTFRQVVLSSQFFIEVTPDPLLLNQFILCFFSRGVESGFVNQPANNRVCRLVSVEAGFYDITSDYLEVYGAFPTAPLDCVNMDYNVFSTLAPIILPLQSIQLISPVPSWDDSDIWDDSSVWPG